MQSVTASIALGVALLTFAASAGAHRQGLGLQCGHQRANTFAPPINATASVTLSVRVTKK
jgi:hypothetical protein